MWFRLVHSALLATNTRHILLSNRRRFISRNVAHCAKPDSNLPSKSANWSPATVSKTIDAHFVKPAPPTITAQTLQYLERLASKNSALAWILSTPIDILVFVELPRQKKIDATIRVLVLLSIFTIAFIAINIIYLFNVYEEHEITKREFCNVTGPGTIQKCDEIILNEIMNKYEGRFVSSSSPIVQNLDRILRKVIESNRETVQNENFDPNWTCIVIDDNEKFDLIVNDEMQFVIVTSATVQQCENEHQLAYLMANALAHFILQHKREPLSNIKPYQLLTLAKLLHCCRVWIVFSSINLFSDWEYFKVIGQIDSYFGQLFYKPFRKASDALNYSDTLEEEADRVALQLLSRSCFDVREAEKISSKFRTLVANFKKEEITPEVIDKYRYIYKHAFNEHKMSYLHQSLPTFLSFRHKCGCSPLN